MSGRCHVQHLGSRPHHQPEGNDDVDANGNENRRSQVEPMERVKTFKVVIDVDDSGVGAMEEAGNGRGKGKADDVDQDDVDVFQAR